MEHKLSWLKVNTKGSMTPSICDGKATGNISIYLGAVGHVEVG